MKSQATSAVQNQQPSQCSSTVLPFIRFGCSYICLLLTEASSRISLFCFYNIDQIVLSLIELFFSIYEKVASKGPPIENNVLSNLPAELEAARCH